MLARFLNPVGLLSLALIMKCVENLRLTMVFLFFPLTFIGWWEDHHRLVSRMFTQTKAGVPSCSQKLAWYNMGFKLPGKRFSGTFKLLNLENSSFEMNDLRLNFAISHIGLYYHNFEFFGLKVDILGYFSSFHCYIC